MHITTAMLADAAQVQGGKLYVLGGGFSTITARRLPAVHPSISVVLVAEVGPEERHRDLNLSIRLVDEDGQPIRVVTADGSEGDPVEAKGRLRIGAPPNLPPGAPSSVPLVSPFRNLRFAEAKGYVFLVLHDDVELTRLPVRIVNPG